MKASCSSSGYLHVQLYANRKASTKLVHKLVAEAFVDNSYRLPEVNHIDGNKMNNRLDNLEWVTKSENLRHAARIGLRTSPMAGRHGKDNPSCKPILQYSLEGTLIRMWDSCADASRVLGINYNCIMSSLSGKGKTCGGFIWKRVTDGDVPQRIDPIVKRPRRYNVPHFKHPSKTKYGKIQQFTLDGELVATWDCCMDAVRTLGIPKQYIYDCLSGKRTSSLGFVWKKVHLFIGSSRPVGSPSGPAGG